MVPEVAAPGESVYSKYPWGPGCTGNRPGAAGAAGEEVAHAGVPGERSIIVSTAAHATPTLVRVVMELRTIRLRAGEPGAVESRTAERGSMRTETLPTT
jgi:hypothetical protein